MNKNKQKFWISSVFNAVNDNQSLGNDWVISAGKQQKKLKRPPVKVNYLGSIADYEPDPLADPKVNQQNEAYFKQYITNNDRVLKQAIDILSQSRTGRYLLEEMTKEGYRIAFDDRRTGAHGAGGLCDAANKLLALRSEKDPYYVALVIGHEAVHALQNAKSDIFPSSLHKPEEGIKLSFAIEADAYAQQVQMALELSYGDSKGPANQIKYDQPLQQMRKRFPDIVKAAEKSFMDAKDLESGLVCAAAFEAFYENPRLRTFYEDAHIQWANMYAPRLMQNKTQQKRNFSKSVKSQHVKSHLLHLGKPYVENVFPKLDLNDEKHSGLSKETCAEVQTFYQSFKPNARPPKLKQFGVHMKDAVSWVLGWSSKTGSVVVKNKNNTPPAKPPLRPPPRFG